MLSPFARHPKLAAMVDPRYIEQCIYYIKNNRPMVRPVFELDMNKIPSIVVASFQGEGVQFIGDYGGEVSTEDIHAPTPILEFDAIEIKENTITAPANQNVYETIWKGLYIKSGDFSSRIDRASRDENGTVTIFTDTEFPSGSPLKGCRVMTSCDQKWYKINCSIDTVKVSITLTTSGDHAIHRLMVTVLRYCLKSGRLMFDDYGMQVATFSQQPATLADDTQLIWQTQFMLEAKVTDHWIVDEGGLVTAPTIVAIKAENPDRETVRIDNWD